MAGGATGTDRPESNVVVIVRLQGGAGNQLFQYAVGRAVSLRQGRRLLIDSRTILPEAPVRQFVLDRFRVNCAEVRGFQAWCTRWVGSVRLGKAFQTVFLPARHFRLIRDREVGYQPEVFKPHSGPLVLQGYWQSHHYFQGIEPVLRKELQFKSVPDQQNAAIIDELRNCNSVCVHVRRGDYVSNPAFAKVLGACDVEYYRRAVERVTHLVSAPRFYVFSDDPNWARRELRLPGPTEVLEHNVGRADIEDLRLMTACRHFIIANSSFSWWGAWLAEAPNKTVIAPARWFLEDKSPPDDRIPSGWIRV